MQGKRGRTAPLSPLLFKRWKEEGLLSDCFYSGLVLGPDLFRVLADREGRGIGVGVLIDRRLELATLAMRVTGDRPGGAVELGGEDGIPKRFAADVGGAALRLGHLVDRLDQELGRIIGLSVEA